MTKCDHTSVGVMVRRKDAVLLINRKKPPYGLAAPAGHVDAHGEGLPSEKERFAAAARSELEEEVGLAATNLALIAEERKNNPCRRDGGTWHYWRIYLADVADEEVTPSESETKGYLWATAGQLHTLLSGGTITVETQTGHEEVALEPVWLEWLTDPRVRKHLPV